MLYNVHKTFYTVFWHLLKSKMATVLCGTLARVSLQQITLLGRFNPRV
jgi:hypothetical protein